MLEIFFFFHINCSDFHASSPTKKKNKKCSLWHHAAMGLLYFNECDHLSERKYKSKSNPSQLPVIYATG